ncbi:MAG: AAA family ATPase, partial [Janthinobacterium sp.]
MSLSKKPYLQSAALRHDAVVDLDHYPFTIPAIRDFVHMDFHPDVTFFVGENGSGKSTMLEALAVGLGFGKDGGTRNVRIALPSDEESGLHAHLRLSKSYKKPDDSYFLRAESFFNVATYMDAMPEYLGSYGGKSLHAQSHGEAFMATLINKLRGKGLYLLDEPEAALSPSRQLAALSVIH